MTIISYPSSRISSSLQSIGTRDPKVGQIRATFIGKESPSPNFRLSAVYIHGVMASLDFKDIYL